MVKVSILFCVLVLSQNLFAAAGGPQDLCISENSSRPQVRQRYCSMVLENLSSGAIKTMVDDIAKGAAAKPLAGMEEMCPGYAQFNGDATKRAMVFQNLIALIIGAESAWNPKVKLSEPGMEGSGMCLLPASIYKDAELTKATGFSESCGTQVPVEASSQIKCCTFLAVLGIKQDMAVKGLGRYMPSFNPKLSPPRLRETVRKTMSDYCRKNVTPGPGGTTPAAK